MTPAEQKEAEANGSGLKDVKSDVESNTSSEELPPFQKRSRRKECIYITIAVVLGAGLIAILVYFSVTNALKEDDPVARKNTGGDFSTTESTTPFDYDLDYQGDDDFSAGGGTGGNQLTRDFIPPKSNNAGESPPVPSNMMALPGPPTQLLFPSFGQPQSDQTDTNTDSSDSVPTGPESRIGGPGQNTRMGGPQNGMGGPQNGLFPSPPQENKDDAASDPSQPLLDTESNDNPPSKSLRSLPSAPGTGTGTGAGQGSPLLRSGQMPPQTRIGDEPKEELPIAQPKVMSPQPRVGGRSGGGSELTSNDEGNAEEKVEENVEDQSEGSNANAEEKVEETNANAEEKVAETKENAEEKVRETEENAENAESTPNRGLPEGIDKSTLLRRVLRPPPRDTTESE